MASSSRLRSVVEHTSGGSPRPPWRLVGAVLAAVVVFTVPALVVFAVTAKLLLDLFHRGGWLNRDSADWFAEYTSHVVDRLSDRVQHWITVNEPQVFIGLGHHRAVHAPGIRYPRSATWYRDVIATRGASLPSDIADLR